MKGYKFLHGKHSRGTLAGRIRLASLASYRAMEGPQWIADANEGVDTAELGSFYYTREHKDAEAQRKRLMDMGIEIDSTSSHLYVESFTNKMIAPQCYIFCFSLDPFETARKAMCEDAPEDFRYDSCIEIADIDQFCRCLCQGRVDDQPLSSLMSEVCHREVSYSKEPIKFEGDQAIGVNPFSKPSLFRYQQEYRILFVPKVSLPDALFVNFTAPAGLLLSKPLT